MFFETMAAPSPVSYNSAPQVRWLESKHLLPLRLAYSFAVCRMTCYDSRCTSERVDREDFSNFRIARDVFSYYTLEILLFVQPL